MPFFEVTPASYTKTTRFYLNTDEGEISQDGYKRYTIPELRNVVSIEVYGFYIQNDSIPTFIAPNGLFNGNNVFEFQLHRSDTGVTKTFVTEFDEKRFFPDSTVDPELASRELGGYMTGLIKATIVPDPDFGPPGLGEAAFEVTNEPPNYWEVRIFFRIRDNKRVANTYLKFFGINNVTGTIAFGTGSRKEDSCALTLGLPEEDLVFTPGDDYVGANDIALKYGKYIDVKIKESRQFDPSVRIFLENDDLRRDSIYYNEIPYQTRNDIAVLRPRVITTDPPYRLKTLTVGLFIDGTRPVPTSIQNHLEIVVHSNSNEETVPVWAQNEVMSL